MRKIVVSIVIILFLIVILGFYFTKYKSAFEADQACHYDQNQNYAENLNLGCDHDLETMQWLLYEKGEKNSKSKVIKRYRY